MSRTLQRIICSVLLITSTGFGYMNTIGVSVPDCWKTLWEFAQNPAHFEAYNEPEGISTIVYTGFKSSDIHRSFEPENVLNYGAVFQTFRQLNEKTRLFAAIDFGNTYYKNQSRSIEKNFYSSYIGFTDTTTGDFQYNGPLIDFYLSRDFGDRVTWGVGINYGVERGIKDVFTRAESRELNSDMTSSVRFRVVTALSVDGWIRRYHGRSSFEAVKEYQDAQVQTWLGYLAFRMENPGSSVDLERNREGYQTGTGLRYQHPGTPLSVYLGFSVGSEENDARKGTKSVASERGYWQRNTTEGLFWLNYKQQKVTWSFFGKATRNEDWGKTGIYDAIFFELDETRYHAGMGLQIASIKNTDMNLMIRGGTVSYDFQNYLTSDVRSRDESAWRVSVDLDIHPFPVVSYTGGLIVEKMPLNYTWNIPSLTRYTVHAGFEYQWGFNRICPALIWGMEKADGLETNNKIWKIRLSVKR